MMDGENMVLNELWGDPFDKCAPLGFNRIGLSILGVSMT